MSYASFSDPDGNSWLLQEIKTRFPGRGLSNFDVATLTELLQETEQHHGEYERIAPKHHWSGWYAAYIVGAPGRQDSRGGGPGRRAPDRSRPPVSCRPSAAGASPVGCKAGMNRRRR
jgi:hypothetical protein